jgi:diguanylate cyclase (GGDEF)-like protein
MFDIRPFWLMGAIFAFGLGSLLLLVKRVYPGNLGRMLMFCGAAGICLGIGWGILYERAWAGEFAFLVLSRVLFTLCLSLQYRAVAELKRQPTSIGWIAGPPLLMFAVCSWFTYADRNQTLLVILFCTIQIALMILIVGALLQPEAGRRPFIDMVVAAVYSMFVLSTSCVVSALVLKGPFSVGYDFSNQASIANNILAILSFAMAFSMYPLMVSERLNRELIVQAMRDSLTGLYNRRAFEEIAFREIAGASRTGAPVSVLVLDVDHFKRVNDEHGHTAGDAVLKAVSDALRDGLRTEDFLCRWGGDEFCAMLPRAGRDQAQNVAERVLKTFESFDFQFAEKSIQVTLSIGIMTDEGHAKDLSLLVQLADAALYQAKQAGRNRFAFALEVDAK